MNKLRTIGVASLMWIMVSAGAQSAADTATDKWDLNRCLEYALENNVQLNKSRLSYASAEASLMQAKGQRLPNLNASISENGSNNRMRDPMTDELGDWKFSVNGSASLNTGVTLYSGGAINNEIQRSTLAKEAALLSVDQTEMDISIAVVQAYVNVLYAYENLKYYKEVVDLSTKQVERARKLLEAGSASRRDIADMEAQLASDNYSVVTATNTLTQRITDLKALLQIPVEQEFNVYIPEEEINVILDALPDIYDVYEATLRNVPDVKYSELQKQMAEIDLKSAKAGYLPTLSASASIGTSYMDPYSLSAGTQFSDNLNERIGLTLSIPIFNRFSTKANVARSKINIESASLTLDNTRNALLQEVERIYQETQAGQQRYLAAIAQKNASEESFSIAQEQYALGMLNSIELQQSRNMWLNANRELIQSRFNALLYRKILDYYLGIPLTM